MLMFPRRLRLGGKVVGVRAVGDKANSVVMILRKNCRSSKGRRSNQNLKRKTTTVKLGVE